MEVGVCCVFFFHSIITYPCDDLYIYTCVCVCVYVCERTELVDNEYVKNSS